MFRVLTKGKYDDESYPGVDAGPPMTYMNTPTENPHELLLRPILVGYAFGPKKMSTMSLVMAEASRAVSTVAIITTNDIPTLVRTRTGFSDSHCINSNGDEQSLGAKSQGNTCETATLTSCWSDQYSKHRFQQNHSFYVEMMDATEAEDERSLEVQDDEEGHGDDDDDDDDDSIHSLGPYYINHCANKESIYLPLCCEDTRDRDDNTNIPFHVHNISKIHRSSSSSAANSTLDELSISTTMPVFQFSPNTISIMSSPSVPNSDLLHYHRINISFVPIDLDFPLEEQHGGKFDVILHKMTEDILFTKFFQGGDDSRIQNSLRIKHHTSSNKTLISSRTQSFNLLPSSCLDHEEEEEEEQDPHALQRVLRLIQYKENHIESVLMDHPQNIQHLMSRSDMSLILSTCLTGVLSRSGLPVSTPRYDVVLGHHKSWTSTQLNASCIGNERNSMNHQKVEEDLEEISRFIDHASLKYPLIAKPLAAAGTKNSHKMVIVLRRDGLYKIPMPCLIQEYVNHNAVLYKCYVLGDRVFVYPRASLPNLPQDECHTISPSADEEDTVCIPPFVEFDSQDSYPTLNDFRHGSLHGNKIRSSLCNDLNTKVEDSPRESISNLVTPRITSEEVQPIADVLRHAFGLELFGFDILLTDRISENGDIEKHLLVVDVNYFPSYKEVPDFAPLLARYLAKRAIENRIHSVLS